MNNVILVGRLVKDPDIQYVGKNNSAISNITLAVPREYKSSNGGKDVDFINVEIWGKQAETCYKYLNKGSRIGIEGNMRVDKYVDSNGNTKYFTKVKASKFIFLDSNKQKSLAESNAYYDSSSIFDKENEGKSLEKLPF